MSEKSLFPEIACHLIVKFLFRNVMFLSDRTDMEKWNVSLSRVQRKLEMGDETVSPNKQFCMVLLGLDMQTTVVKLDESFSVIRIIMD